MIMTMAMVLIWDDEAVRREPFPQGIVYPSSVDIANRHSGAAGLARHGRC